MRRIDLLIAEARTETDNTLFTDETGLQDSEFLRWANSAQKRMLSKIHKTHPGVLQLETVIPVSAGVAEYDIPEHTFMKSQIISMWFSSSGNESDYYPITSKGIKERSFGNGSPSYYIRKSEQFLLQPIPDTSGYVKVISQWQIPRLDIRRGIVSAVTLDTGAKTITQLVCDSTLNIDEEVLENEGYITIVDAYGNIKMEGIPITDVNTTTGVITISPGFVFDTGETIAVGDYVVSGNYSTTHSNLPEICEDYLVDFMIWKAEKRDSNVNSAEISAELQAQENEIVDSFEDADQDVSGVANIDKGFLE